MIGVPIVVTVSDTANTHESDVSANGVIGSSVLNEAVLDVSESPGDFAVDLTSHSGKAMFEEPDAQASQDASRPSDLLDDEGTSVFAKLLPVAAAAALGVLAVRNIWRGRP